MHFLGHWTTALPPYTAIEDVKTKRFTPWFTAR